MPQPKVVFMGSGPVAAESLRLLRNHCDIEAVITKPTTVDMLQDTAGDSPVYTVSSKHELDALLADKHFTSSLGVLIDFGIIVSRNAIGSFALGIINSHFSLLPLLRGADPISFAILEGHDKTGVSLMLIDEGMDTGKLLVTKSLALDGTETTPVLTHKLILLSDELLAKTIAPYAAGEITPRTQPHPDRATYTRKLTKQDGLLDWHKPAVQLEREIRAFADWPKSRTVLGDKDVIITAAHAEHDHPANGEPGKVIVNDQTKEFGVITDDGTLWINALKPAGKKEMPAKAFLAGYGHLL